MFSLQFSGSVNIASFCYFDLLSRNLRDVITSSQKKDKNDHFT